MIVRESFNGLHEGDRVVFKEWDEMAAEYGVSYDAYGSECILVPDRMAPMRFSEEMRYLCGCEAVVYKLIWFLGGISEIIELINGDDGAFIGEEHLIVPNMVKKIESTSEFADVNPDEWLDFLTNNEQAKGEI